ncbi:MAG: ribosome maturation factor RimP [Bacillota bacterium]|nr:ribosome maturation factor RimP [Bacillota bacterium]
MKKDVLLENLNKLIKPIVISLGYDLYFIEYIKEEGEKYLRVYIDKEGGISLEDCERVSRPVSDLLDAEDPIPESYFLEVSSPGMFRQLFNDEHLSKYKGSMVAVNLESIIEGKKSLKGTLLHFDDNNIYLSKDNEELMIPREKIKTINLEGSLKEVSTNE